MTLVRRLARPMLAGIFVSGGADALMNPAAKAKAVGDTAHDVADALPVSLPEDPETLIKIDAGAKILGGLMLAGGGKLARPGALVCATSLVWTTWAAHRFWEMDDKQERAQNQIQFMKNLSILGGLLITAVDTSGRESVPHMAKRGAHDLADKAGGLADRASDLLPT